MSSVSINPFLYVLNNIILQVLHSLNHKTSDSKQQNSFQELGRPYSSCLIVKMEMDNVELEIVL